jgi:hypothetical protein
MPQGWRPAGLPPSPPAPEVTRDTVIRYDTRVPWDLNAYAVVHFVAALLLAVALLAAENSWARGELFVAAALVLWALLDIGGIFDHRRWALPSEIIRLPVTAVLLAAKLPESSWRAPAQWGVAAAVVAMWIYLFDRRRQFDDAPQLPSRVLARLPSHDGATEAAPVRAGAEDRPGALW